MIIDEIRQRILAAFGHIPTQEQGVAVDRFCQFLLSRHEQSAMILRGSAGTGKTTLAAAIVRALTALRQPIVLLAPTGRAAKVFALYADHAAFTIHRRIYRQKSLEGGFTLGFNAASDTLFIVDEASMIASSNGASFADGGGSLLDDLVRFVYGGRNCRLVLIGDRAQLPPVGETESPALHAAMMRSYGLEVCECDLNEVLRQSRESGILLNATRIRQLLQPTGGGGAPLVLPKVRFQGFADIVRVMGDELIESLSDSYAHVGRDETLVVTRSNKRANIYNQGIRNQVLGCEEQLCSGDQLMIVKNNYSVLPAAAGATAPAESAADDNNGMGAFLANGDRCVVRRVRNVHEQHGFHFAEVTMTFPDYNDYELTAMIMLDTLTSEAPALTREQQQQLYESVLADYADVRPKQERLKKVREDRYYNALQVKFAYAATCHKAQGGQWTHVYVDQGYMTDDMLSVDYVRWLYTAFTRATQRLYLVNWPKTQTEAAP